MLKRQIGRAKNESASKSIKLDERQGRRKLILRHDEDCTAVEFSEPATKARALSEIAQSDAGIGAPEQTVRPVSRGAQ